MEFSTNHSEKLGMFSEFENNSEDFIIPSKESTLELTKELKHLNKINNKENSKESTKTISRITTAKEVYSDKSEILTLNYIDKKTDIKDPRYNELIKKLPVLINEITDELIKNNKITSRTKQEKAESTVLNILGNRLRKENIYIDLDIDTIARIKNLIAIKIAHEFNKI